MSEEGLPEEGRCYKAENGEKVEVTAVCYVVGAVDGDSPDGGGLPVVIAYRNSGRHSGRSLALHESDWRSRNFVPISRGEFCGPVREWSHAAGWAVVFLAKVSKLRECRDSREVAVVRVVGVHGPDGSLTVSFWLGKQKAEREPLDGLVYDFREDARRAKLALCEFYKIKLANASDHYDYADVTL